MFNGYRLCRPVLVLHPLKWHQEMFELRHMNANHAATSVQQPTRTSSEHLQFRFGVLLLNRYKHEQAFLNLPILNTYLVFDQLSSADLGDERIASHNVVRAAPATANDKTSMFTPLLHHSTTSILCNLYAHTLCRAEWRQTVIARSQEV